jgi:two-component system CheB/CheR fusion protein
MESTTEELQSVNEELNTVNDELRAKIDEVDQGNADMRNILDSTRIATVFLDRNLAIRTFTSSMTAIFNLIPSDQGRPLTDIATSLEDIPDLKREIKSVFDSGEIIERRVHKSDVHYLMRVLPYRGNGAVIEGSLLTFIDVSTIVASEIRQADVEVQS